jgi:two-component system cell cycle response regulator
VTDELTELYNRRHFYEVLESEMRRTRRYGGSFSLIMLDLDGLKQYNDRFGHTNGDAVLRCLAQTIKSIFRNTDTAFRYGGDEFTIILPATDADIAKNIVGRLRSEWLQVPRAPYPIVRTPIEFSTGIAQFPEDAETADGLIFLVDTALYRAKRQEGYKCALVSELVTLETEASSLETLDPIYALAAVVVD